MINKHPDIETVLFDLDGTLADSLPLIRHCYFTVFSEMGIPWGNGDVMRWIGRPLKDIAVHFAGEDPSEYFIERYQYHYHRDHDQYTSIYPGTLEMLRSLKESMIKTGVVTSKGRPGTMRTVEFTGMVEYLDVIITANDVERHKPLPDPVYKAMDLLGSVPESTVFVGDSHYDLEAGKAAGIRVLGITWGISSAGELARYCPERILGDWEDLISYIYSRGIEKI
ncbi:MAG: haloacid dehalogenase [Peptococcaceae bacterium BICA1-7]|nr:MAG: haloacid dehalogenase [Peptococcaceae bacterium BICA1-7]HBV98269.1 haloacid dehalogenase [Desulfotomaculum sp.]